MTQNITTPVAPTALIAAQADSPAIVSPSGRILVKAGSLAFVLGSYEGDADYLAAQLNAAV